MRTLNRLLPLMGLLLGDAIQATPYTPQSDTEIVARLPTQLINRGERQELRRLRQQLHQQPGQLKTALALAWRSIQLGRSEADPRYYGYAQAAVQRWWTQPQPPLEVLVLRATLRQNRHDFALAERDLHQALQWQPHHTQARLTLATLQTVQGRYSEARRNCRALARRADWVLTAACFDHIASLTGQAESAYQRLQSIALAQSQNPMELQLWVLTLLADIAERLGNTEAARQHYQTALALPLKDQSLLRAYSDFLLTQKQPETVLALLKHETRSDDLLLRLALAEQQLESPQLRSHLSQLNARYRASRQRGSQVHTGSEARFVLELLHQPKRAVRLAEQNWAIQKEPVDARLLAATALQSNREDLLDVLRAWVENTGLQDLQLHQLLYGRGTSL